MNSPESVAEIWGWASPLFLFWVCASATVRELCFGKRANPTSKSQPAGCRGRRARSDAPAVRAVVVGVRRGCDGGHTQAAMEEAIDADAESLLRVEEALENSPLLTRAKLNW